MRAKYAANPEHYKKQVEKYRREVLGQLPRRPKQTREQYLAKKREGARLRAYGIDSVGFNSMLSAQRNRCLICNDEFTNTKTRHVDHSHETGKVRGLLCDRCNRGLGCFRDNSAILLKAVSYLKVSQDPPSEGLPGGDRM